MENLKSNFLALEVFDNGSRKIIGFYKNSKEPFELLDKHSDKKIEVLSCTTIKRNFKINDELEYKQTQNDKRAKRQY
ncbi:hypothetical protein [Mycoplasma sp. CSL7503-lung]|uniref:hypothetical protein n=1 Tax=Mycoplasma sp. CSL7503-lung TaxID=536372 RepID=UPI0021CE45BF|nr:hypothetical protein [Mycoplasma sp. CSL7503-lung]MCU4706438.1 hypothetical protein [Mycoplasma sp. CSL7503-lung]